jgi:Fe-S cluster assembly ATP-binding protein
MLLITHYQRLLSYIVPDYVHVLLGGRIVKSGGKELALTVEEKGYAWLEKEVQSTAPGQPLEGQSER